MVLLVFIMIYHSFEVQVRNNMASIGILTHSALFLIIIPLDISDTKLREWLADRHDVATNNSNEFWVAHLRRPSNSWRAILFLEDWSYHWRRSRFAHALPILPYRPGHASTQVFHISHTVTSLVLFLIVGCNQVNYLYLFISIDYRYIKWDMLISWFA